MTWTTETPTKPGAYWLKQGTMVSLVSVEPWQDNDVVAVLHEGDVVDMQPGDWIVSYFWPGIPRSIREEHGRMGWATGTADVAVGVSLF